MEAMETMPQTRGVTLDATGRGVILGNPHRRAIIIGCPPTKTIFVIVGPADGQGVGPLVNSNLGFLELTQERYGTGIQQSIQIIATDGAASAGQVVGYCEFLTVT